jgi:hypothetical protein
MLIGRKKSLSNRTFLIVLITIQALFFQGSYSFSKIFVETLKVQAITEDENEISLRDASSTRERPTLEGLDIPEDVFEEAEVLTSA